MRTDLFQIPSTPEPSLTTARKRLAAAEVECARYAEGCVPWDAHNALYFARIELEQAERERMLKEAV